MKTRTQQYEVRHTLDGATGVFEIMVGALVLAQREAAGISMRDFADVTSPLTCRCRKRGA